MMHALFVQRTDVNVCLQHIEGVKYISFIYRTFSPDVDQPIWERFLSGNSKIKVTC